MARPGPKTLNLEVIRTEWVTPHLVEVFLGGEQFDQFECNPATDRYTKLLFRRPGDERPLLRTYTIRRHNPREQELSIQFVTHGDSGIAAPWAAAARPGDTLELFAGSGGGYRPDPSADWHVFIGDASAFPAIANALEVLPAEARAIAMLETDDGPITFETAADLDLRWIDRAGAVPGARLIDEVRGASWPSGDIQAFVHGELAAIRQLRPHLRDERGLPPERLSISGYWRHGKDEDGFQAEKRAEAT